MNEPAHMAAGRRRARRRGGFTLLELLVVIVCMALVAAMLVPSLARAQDQTRLRICQHNLRNLLTAAILYAKVNDRALPVSEHLANPHVELLTAMQPYAGGRMFYCPAERRPELSWSPENQDAGIITYFYYSCRRRTTYLEASHFLWRNGASHPKWPRLITLGGVQGATEWQSDPWVFSDRWVSAEQPHPFGQKGLNYASLDGTVTLVKRTPREEFR